MREEQTTFTPKRETKYTLEQKVQDLILVNSGWNTELEQKLFLEAQSRLGLEARIMMLEAEKQKTEEAIKSLKG